MAFNVYHNPTSVTIGSTAITGVQSIAVREEFAEIHAAGDSDAHESVARYGTGRTSGTITLLDPVSAEAASGKTGTLSATLTDVKGAADKTLTISNCSIGPWNADVSRDAASRCTLSFVAESAPALA